jgi:AcrR family transcriptional regulator
MTGSPTISERVLQAAADLLESGGVDAVSTRAVAAGAGPQAPAIYRQFGDMDGLLVTLTTFLLTKYLTRKRRALREAGDAVADLRGLWDMHVDIGLRHPDSYVPIYGRALQGRMTQGAAETRSLLGEAIGRVGEQGLLKMSVERATSLMHAAGVGLVMTQIAIPASDRDPEVPDIARESALAAILSQPKRKTTTASDLPARAMALRQAMSRQDDVPLSPAETALLGEWLNRLANRV